MIKKDIRTKIQRDIGKLLAKKTGVPVYMINKENVEKMCKIAKKNSNLSRYYTDKELCRETSRFYSVLVAVPPKSEKELEERVEKFLKNLITEKKYTAIILLEGVYDLPIGIKMGNLKIIKQDMKRKILKTHLKYLEKNDKIKVDKCSWYKIEFQSYKSENIREILYEQLEVPFSILSLFLHRHIDPKQLAGIIYNTHNKRTYLLEPSVKFNGWTRFDKTHFGKYLLLLSKITKKQSPTRLEQKILRSLLVYWLAQSSRKIEIQFLLIVAATEALLLTETDRDYLGMKFAEKTAFLLSDKGEKQLKIYKLMKQFYGKRSKIIHAGKKEVNLGDVKTMQNVYLNLVLKLLDLSKKYTQMEQKSKESQKEGIEDLLLKQKFSVKHIKRKGNKLND